MVARLSGFTESTAELAKENAYLEDLGNWFRSTVAKRRLKVLVYAENLPTNGTKIVDNHSANPGLVDVQSIPIALNHLQLAGPRQHGDQISDGVIKFVRGLASQMASPAALPVSTLMMEVGVLQTDVSQWTRGADTVLRYSLQRSESTAAINCELGYMNTFRTGGPIYPMSYLTPTRCPFLWDYPTLDLKFVNNTDRTIFLSELVIDVDESKPIQEPLIAIRRDVQQRHAGNLMLVNEGWTEVSDLRLSFNIKPGLIADPLSIQPPYKHSIDAGVLVDRLDIDVGDAFAAEDELDLEDLVLLTNGDWTADGQFELPEVDGKRERLTQEELRRREEKALGPFKDWVGTLVGEMIYTSAAAPSERRAVKFQAFVYLANANRVGIPKPVTFQYQVALEAEARSYKKVIAISQEIKAGDTDRFALKIGVPQSSCHRFSLKARDVSGEELRSAPVTLECFAPRSVRTRLHPSG
jgi:hypothetical protein